MMSIPGYQIQEKFSEGLTTDIYRGKRLADSMSVVFKFLKGDFGKLENITDLQNEYEILHSIKLLNVMTRFQHEYNTLKLLKNSGVVSVYGLEKYNHSFVMILEDAGEDLQRYLLHKKHLTILEALTLSIGIAECLDKIHKQHIIHKNINPTNILIAKDTHQIKLIDFDLSTSLAKETPELLSLNQIEGMLSYLSPEQTGRMNRGIDYRSDYYSLGVIYYQMFTGKLPFEDAEPLELIHAHIAKRPVPPHIINAAIPLPISNIIMKLLEKNAEDRYQTLYGLLYDLKFCRNQLQKTDKVDSFVLAEKDFSGKFQIPEKLYGRQYEIEFLLNTFNRVSTGHSELMLIAGHSGIGKSSLVHEIHKPIVEKHGYFISGKFDQLKRNIPYAPFVQALDGLIQQILTDSDHQENWKQTILNALGPNGGIIAEVLPSLTKIIGAQPAPAVLGPSETQNRFIAAFQAFIQVLATQDHPLVIFLDDLQWLDLPSLYLLRSLLAQPDIRYLLIIGAYRDNEVDASHPLMFSLESFKKTGIVLQTLNLRALQVPHIQQLLAETLAQDIQAVYSLAEICYTKTLGNPFFLNQFLRALYEENFIMFDIGHEFWHWEIERIKARKSTENVVDLVVSNIKKLSPEALLILEYAACLGDRFDLQTLAMLHEKTCQKTAELLLEIMQENFIIPLDENYKLVIDNSIVNPKYQFLHDRVQQAAYSLLSTEQKKNIHLKIGLDLLNSANKARLEEKLFDIVNQLNLCSDLLVNLPEKIDLAQLNYRSGIKAGASAAYSVAYNYFKLGLELLDSNIWQTQYETAMEMYAATAEAAYLSDDLVAAESYCNQVLTHAKSVLDQVKAYETKIFIEIARNAPASAVAIALEVLKKLGISFPKNVNKFHVLLAIFKTKCLLFFKTHDHLVNLAAMKEPYKLAACNILSATIAPSYYAAPMLYPLITLELVNLSIRYGYNKGAPAAYASYGIISCGVLNEIQSGDAFGQLALMLIEKNNAVESEVKVSLMVYGLIAHWSHPYRNSLTPLLIAHLRGIQTGDLDYSAYAAYFYVECGFLSGIQLPQVVEDTKKFYEICKNRHTHKPVLLSISVLGQALENLVHPRDDAGCLTGTYFNEITSYQEAIQINHQFGLYNFYNNKLMLNYLFYNYSAALEAAKSALNHVASVTAGPALRSFNLYESLTLLALISEQNINKAKYLKKVAKNQKQLKQWASHAPANCLSQHTLVEAERMRINGQIEKAEELYKKAIELAEQYEYLQIKALAYELAAKMYFSEKNSELAQQYLNQALHAYREWGATAKVKHLERLMTDKGC